MAPWARVLAIAVLACSSLGFEWPGERIRLRRQLRSEDADVRLEAVQKLSTCAPDRCGELLLTALQDAELRVRLEAARSAAQVGLRRAVPPLLDWLDDPSAKVRAAAATALGTLDGEQVVAPLVRGLGDADATVRLAAARALGRLGDDAGVVPLLGRLDDPDPSVRVAAVRALGSLGDKRAVVPLMGRVRDDAVEVRVAVYETLAQLGDRRALPALQQGLREDVEEARLAAIAALGRLGAPGAVDSLKQHLRAADTHTALAAVAALSAIPGAEAGEVVLSQLAEPRLRSAASDALVSRARRARILRGPAAVEPLRDRMVRALRDARDAAHVTALAEALRALAAWVSIEPAAEPLLHALGSGHGEPAVLLRALAATGSERALMPLLEQLHTAPPHAVEPVLRALRIYFERTPPDGRAADPLLEALTRVKNDQRPAVVRLLGRVGAPRMLDSLVPLLDHDDVQLRLAAIEALGRLGHSDAARPLIEQLEARRAELRFAAAQALGSTATAQQLPQLLQRLDAKRPVDRDAVLIAIGGVLQRRDERDPLPDALARRTLQTLRRWARGANAHLAARAIEALGRWSAPEAAPVLGKLVGTQGASRRAQALWALGFFDMPEATEALRFVFDYGGRRELTAAAGALGQHGGRRDAEHLFEAASKQPWPIKGAIAFGLARMAKRGVLDEPRDRERLCRLAESREPYVRANVAAALAALQAPPCSAQVNPLAWMNLAHAPVVRGAAARWAWRLEAAGTLPSETTRQRLLQCVERNLDPSVTAFCEADGASGGRNKPQLPDRRADLYVYGPDGKTLLRDRLVAVRFSDGSVWVAFTDVNGHLYLPGAPSGRMWVEDPAQTPIEPRVLAPD